MISWSLKYECSLSPNRLHSLSTEMLLSSSQIVARHSSNATCLTHLNHFTLRDRPLQRLCPLRLAHKFICFFSIGRRRIAKLRQEQQVGYVST